MVVLWVTLNINDATLYKHILICKIKRKTKHFERSIKRSYQNTKVAPQGKNQRVWYMPKSIFKNVSKKILSSDDSLMSSENDNKYLLQGIEELIHNSVSSHFVELLKL